MRNERKYRIISLLTLLLAFLLLGNTVREFFRMDAAVAANHQDYVLKGAKTYAQNCVQCHGPKGEGVIGMPLNRADYQVDYQSPAGKDIYNMLVQTIKQGRPGDANIFRWEKAPDGKWISYTAMPAWHRDFGGPLDDDYVQALAMFIMEPGAQQWNIVGDADLAPYQAAVYEDPETGEIPLPDSANSDVNAPAKALLRNLTKSQCLTCHTIGSAGAKVGPDLSRVGAWGIDQQFLENWIKYANVPNKKDADQTPAVPHDVRMPVYWSANRATLGPELNLQKQTVSTGTYYMPRFKGKLTDDEISTIARYLMGLK